MKYIKYIKKLTWIFENKTFWLFIITAFALRVVGSRWGFPFLYHPDEPTLVRDALGVSQFDLKLEHFDWPHLQTYISSWVITLFVKFRGLINILGLGEYTKKLFPLMWDDTLVFYFLTRLLTAFMGALSVGIVYLCGVLLRNRKVGVLAALIMMLNPLHLSESRLATIDVPMVMWVSTALYFSLLISRYGRWRDYILSALAVGLATSTKYNGGFAILTVIVASVLFILSNTAQLFQQIKKLIMAGFISVFGFFTGTPNALFDWDIFSSTEGPEGAFWQFTRAGNTKGNYFERIFPRLRLNSVEIYGYFGLMLAFLSSFLKRSREYLLLGLFPLAYFLFVIGFGYFQPHFLLPIAPYLSVLVAMSVYDVSTYKQIRIKEKNIFLILSFFVLLSPTYSSLKGTYKIAQPDTRTLAFEWIKERRSDSMVIVTGDDYEPDFSRLEGPGSLKEKSFSDFEKDASYDEDMGVLFDKNKVTHMVLGGYELGKIYDNLLCPSEERPRLCWLKKEANLVVRYDPLLNPGPTVLIFEWR